jgi:hypothetical protein
MPYCYGFGEFYRRGPDRHRAGCMCPMSNRPCHFTCCISSIIIEREGEGLLENLRLANWLTCSVEPLQSCYKMDSATENCVHRDQKRDRNQ